MQDEDKGKGAGCESGGGWISCTRKNESVLASRTTKDRMSYLQEVASRKKKAPNLGRWSYKREPRATVGLDRGRGKKTAIGARGTLAGR